MDEDIIFPALKELYKYGFIDLDNKQQKLIFVPHEVDTITINRLLKKLEKYSFTANFWLKN